MSRCEEEHLIGHELIKVWTNFKVSSIPILSSSSRHEPPSNNKAMIVHSIEN
jgi:hypothetical protein